MKFRPFSPSTARPGVAVLLATLALLPAAHAELSFTDDSGRAVHLKGAARRIVTLAPHATEILYAAGATTRRRRSRCRASAAMPASTSKPSQH